MGRVSPRSLTYTRAVLKIAKLALGVAALGTLAAPALSQTMAALAFLPQSTACSVTPGNSANYKARDISFTEAQPVLQDFSDDLPPDLRGLTDAEARSRWPQYVHDHDSATRQRLLEGDEDSLVNLLLYGTSFTNQPRVTREFMSEAGPQVAASGAKSLADNRTSRVVQLRIAALLNALSAPGASERLKYMRQLMECKGIRFDRGADHQKAQQYLVTLLERVQAEFAEYSKTLQASRSTGDPNQEFAVRSTLFKDRGISLDTSIMPDYALEEALKQLLNLGVLTKGSIRRVAVIGPGLDFADKSEGFDFYPQQTTQPFLLLDSLLRLGLSRKDDVSITTLDISPRVNQHIALIRQRAKQGTSYVLQLPLPADRTWEVSAKAFWQKAGEFIGATTKPVPAPPSAGKLYRRAVRIPPQLVLRIAPEEMNLVWQRLDLPAAQHYDLVVATNVLVYYDEFHQALALDNIQSMLRENGVLLTNNGLPEVPSLAMKQSGHSATAYSDRSADGDYIVWYRQAR